MTNPERFTVLTGGTSADERDERLATGATELAERRGRAGLLGNERFLLTLAASLMTFGICVILLGWYGAAHSTLTEEQTPYLISGGLLGAALALIGAVCLLAHWLTVLIREGRARDAEQRRQHAELLEALRSVGGSPLAGDDGAPNGAAAGPRRAPVPRAPRGS